jgi:hypothetical protein
MHPSTVCGPPLACPARGPPGQGNRGIHAQTEPRCLGPECRKTFTTTKGPAWYRLWTSPETVTRVGTLLAHGCPLQASVVAGEVEERTVAAGVRRAGVQGQAGQDQVVEPPRDRGQGHADESRVQTQGGVVWMALAMRVSTRVWRAGEGSAQRDLPWIRRRIERGRAWALHRPLLCGTAGGCASVRALRETLREPVRTGVPGRPRRHPWRNVCLAQVVQRYAQRRVVEGERRRVDGTPARVEPRRRRSQGGGVIKTASIERLNATLRERLASLTRRGRARARRTLTLQHGMSRIGTV